MSLIKDTLGEVIDPEYYEMCMRLLFCTTIACYDGTKWNQYRIRDTQIYAHNDPYTRQLDEKTITKNGWYFQRTSNFTKEGGALFALVGTAGGILIRGISRVNHENQYQQEEYIDGPYECTKELLRACGVSEIKDMAEYDWLNIQEHEPAGITLDNGKEFNMEWKAVSRKPGQIKERVEFYRAPLRFLQAPFETKNERKRIRDSPKGGIFSAEHFHAFTTGKQKAEHCTNLKEKHLFGVERSHDEDMSLPGENDNDDDGKLCSSKSSKRKHWFHDRDSDRGKARKKNLLGGRNDNGDSYKESPKASGQKFWYYHGLPWYYVLEDGENTRWDSHNESVCAELEKSWHEVQSGNLLNSIVHRKFGCHSYTFDITRMIQTNKDTGKESQMYRGVPSKETPPLPVININSASLYRVKSTPGGNIEPQYQYNMKMGADQPIRCIRPDEECSISEPSVSILSQKNSTPWLLKKYAASSNAVESTLRKRMKTEKDLYFGSSESMSAIFHLSHPDIEGREGTVIILMTDLFKGDGQKTFQDIIVKLSQLEDRRSKNLFNFIKRNTAARRKTMWMRINLDFFEYEVASENFGTEPLFDFVQHFNRTQKLAVKCGLQQKIFGYIPITITIE